MESRNLIALVALILLFGTSNAKRGHSCSSSCGNVVIKRPFRLKSHPKRCGKSRFELSCENNVTVLHFQSGKYFVQEIDYDHHTIRVVDSNVQKNNCSSIPNHSLNRYNFTNEDAYSPDQTYKYWPSKYHRNLTRTILFLKCENPVKSPVYISTDPCLAGVFSSKIPANSSQSKRYYYYAVDGLRASDWNNHCNIEQKALASAFGVSYGRSASFMDIHDELAYGFELSWSSSLDSCVFVPPHIYSCYSSGEGNCQSAIPLIFGVLFFARFFGIPSVILLLICTWTKRHLSMYNHVEEFLQRHNNLLPIRFSHSDVRLMTREFREKLGEGGYGSVYKGRLGCGRLVAIKMLENSKAHGEDFINEVATIGRIHHVNIVNLIGFCVDGSKRALVYDYMPKGSLDKLIFSNEGAKALCCKKTLEIATGVARGIEYLHQGCEMRILHFDIKPHNILLDGNFIPKVSDFGLSRLCPLDSNDVSITAARGTLGYIAPELFYKNIGGISYKADVYSFGMLLMEMASGRKNLNAVAEHSSQIYFPSWVYDQFSEGKNIQEVENVADEDLETIKKMIIVALWCIQLKPSDRPSMSKVIEMLEGEVERLQLPPRPSYYPQEEPMENTQEASDSIPSNCTMLSPESEVGF